MITFSEAERQLKAIAEETRLKIITYLTKDTLCVCELVALLNMSQPSISQHLKRLKQEDLILEERRGKWVYYSMNSKHPSYTLLLHLVGLLPPVNNHVEVVCD